MSVYTTVTPEELSMWLNAYSVGHLVELKGISSGIENTNYFLTTSENKYILTIFEKLTHQELHWYIDLMDYLSHHDITAPMPISTNKNTFLGTLKEKPACIVSFLKGQSVMNPDESHCAEVGKMLAKMHLAGQHFPRVQDMPNPRGLTWWQTTATQVYCFLTDEEQRQLDTELRQQINWNRLNLPKGVIHADLFRDNALFDGHQLGGFIDFYFACEDYLMYDVAITLNDWCLDHDTSTPNLAKCKAFLQAYQEIRPFTSTEEKAWQQMLCAGALRFWLSRLYDLHFPRAGEMTHAKNPKHFAILLKYYHENQLDLH